MSQYTDDDVEGDGFYTIMRSLEDSCDAQSSEALPTLGEKAPKLHTTLGTLLSLLDRASSCYWGCQGGDHAVEYLTGGVCNSARAALRLMCMGFYDEALTVSRSIAERVNLVSLFLYDPDTLTEWRSADERVRRRKYSAVQVRLRLEQGDWSVPTDQDRYSKLSGYGAHPGHSPQHFIPHGPPAAGGLYSEIGLLVSLNEIGRSVILYAGICNGSMNLPKEVSQRLRDVAVEAAHQLGGANLDGMDEYWEKNVPK
ncbi:hypothetical protein [Streptomyces roseus]|uniref:hypothetical protein n=1 Tax=Streptomyces roseus TaxID=66430 RepID=UPI000AFDFB7B|nr:hypothetical protein [Streptomyces roseus]